MTDLASDTIRILVFLLPGFLTIRVISMKCDLKEQSQQEMVIDALLYSLVVYAGLGVLWSYADLSDPLAALAAVAAALLLGMIVSEARNRDWLGRAFARSRFGLSVHEKVLYQRGAEKLSGHWHVIGLKNGKEILGVVRNVDTNTNEMLIEGARWLMGSVIVGEPQWLYLPPDTELEYIIAMSDQARASEV
jgi:hypothetical protein